VAEVDDEKGRVSLAQKDVRRRAVKGYWGKVAGTCGTTTNSGSRRRK